MKRAITLAGGGPAAGLHIGVLERLANAEISSIMGLCPASVHGSASSTINAIQGKKLSKLIAFFNSGVFQRRRSYKRFPINSVFGSEYVRQI